MSDIRTHYVVVADDAPECVIRKAVHIKAKILDTDTHINEIKVVRQNELRRYHSMSDNTQELREKILNIMPCIDGTCDKHGTVVGGTMDDPEPYQCQFCYEQRFAAADKAVALIKSQTNQAVLEARIDEVDNIGDIGADFSDDSKYRKAVENYVIKVRNGYWQELTQEVQTDE